MDSPMEELACRRRLGQVPGPAADNEGIAGG